MSDAGLFADMLVFIVRAFLRRSFDELDLHWAADKIEHSPAGVSWIAGYGWDSLSAGWKFGDPIGFDPFLARFAWSSGGALCSGGLPALAL